MSLVTNTFTYQAGEDIDPYHSIAYDPSTEKWYYSHNAVVSPPFRIEAISIGGSVLADEYGTAISEGLFNWPGALPFPSRNLNTVVVSRTDSSLGHPAGLFADVGNSLFLGYIYNDAVDSGQEAQVQIFKGIRSWPFSDFYPSTKTINAGAAFYDALLNVAADTKIYCSLRIPSGMFPLGVAKAGLLPIKYGIVVHYTTTVTSGTAILDMNLSVTRVVGVYNSGAGSNSKTASSTGHTAVASASAMTKSWLVWEVDAEASGWDLFNEGAELNLTITRKGNDAGDTMAASLLITGVDLYV